ncbi:MAG: FAD-dependent oxidoreductase [Chloroherpetonaceae bacterium]|nr:FAD-dependent oxidoreductase [Chloroherpetonaceae bacterium]
MQKLLILGSGFAAMSLVKHIDLRAYDVTVLSPRNHFLFSPLLPSTTVGTIEFRSIIEPVRRIRKGIHYLQARAVALSKATQTVTAQYVNAPDTFDVQYDKLVIAVGAVNNTFGIEGAAEYALFLRELSDARAIRQKILDNFEQASLPSVVASERKRLLHTVVVGGGPTGVEFAAELSDFLSRELKAVFPHIIGDARITLLEAGNQILSTFDAKLRSYTMKVFARQNVEVRTNSFVRKVTPRSVVLASGEELCYGLLVWLTGNAPSPFVLQLPFEHSRTGAILTDGYLRVKGETNIFAAGDCATIEDDPQPATAQVAQQEGIYLAKLLNAMAKLHTTAPPLRRFKRINFGMLAYIGDNRAVADLPQTKSGGFATWLFWRSAYLTKLVSLKNKMQVLFDWLKTSLFGRDVSRF